MRNPADPLSWLAALTDAPFRHDFFQTLRRVECAWPDQPRLGEALRPADEKLRLGQEPSLDFAPAALSVCEPDDGRGVPVLRVRFFGLFGPNGPLPLHLSEHARDRLQHAGDPTLARFTDLFHHRLLLLFYRAWAQAQPVVSLDRPHDDRFAGYVGAFFGLTPPAARSRDAVGDMAKLYYSGWLARQARNADGLAALLGDYFRLPVRVEEFCGHWLRLGPDDRTRLGCRRESGALGRGTVAGRRVWDRQHKIRLHLGPMSLEQYHGFLPGGRSLGLLVDWVRQYLSFEFEWDVRLLLRAEDVPRATLGRRQRLGWTAWSGPRRRADPAGELIIDPEKLRHETLHNREREACV